MRVLAVLLLGFLSTSAFAGGVHKCERRNGQIYYSDKACSTRNHREPGLGESDSPDKARHPASPTAKKLQKSKKKALPTGP